MTGSSRAKLVKCVVWDLDQTLWDGVLLEGDPVSLRPGVLETIRHLDGRGILHSIASRNEEAAAKAELARLGVADYFLSPQINWNPKSTSVRKIAERLNIGLDALVFVDDQRYEREEVRFALPEVRCFDACDVATLPDRPAFQPRRLTDDARRRRIMMQQTLEREQAETAFEGPKEAFLATLGMVFTIAPAGAGDLARAEELTQRTSQLNTTGKTYSLDELDAFRCSGDHLLLMARLEDRFGSYGHVGLGLVQCDGLAWTIRLLLMSCRVMAHGVGTVFLNYLMAMAKRRGVRLYADFVPNDRNRMMLVAYRFAGFVEIGEQEGCLIMENDLNRIAPCPDYLTLRTVL